MTKLRISPDGRIRGLWDDEVRLGDLGIMRVRRASHVEFDDCEQCWAVREAKPRSLRWAEWVFSRRFSRVLHRAPTRCAALAWEHAHFQPGGPGWRNP